MTGQTATKFHHENRHAVSRMGFASCDRRRDLQMGGWTARDQNDQTRNSDLTITDPQLMEPLRRRMADSEKEKC